MDTTTYQAGQTMPSSVVHPLSCLHSQVVSIFGPFQIITSYNDNNELLYIINKIEHNLTAAVVSNDLHFTNEILSNTINGTTYVGMNARTTGAPQNHFFGPAGDPRGAGIGTPEAIKNVWSCHREIIYDF